MIAIDPGINECGFCYCHGNEELSGVLKPKGKEYPERLFDLAEQLKMLLRGNAPFYLPVLFSPPVPKNREVMVIEIPGSFAYARSTGYKGKALNTASLMILSRAVGVIEVVGMEFGMDVIEVPVTWKGKMNKELSRHLTKTKNHNEADAILLSRWYRLKKGEITC